VESGTGLSGVALLDIAADDSSWAKFYLGEPGFLHDEVPFVADDGSKGVAVARLSYIHDSESRAQEGGEDCWFKRGSWRVRSLLGMLIQGDFHSRVCP